MSVIEQREAPRFILHWRAAIVHKNNSGKEEIFHGRTRDISTSGMAICSERNVFTNTLVTVLLAVPPLNPGEKQKVIEVQSKMVYTVHSSTGHGFRIGLRFIKFKGDGKKVLTLQLEHRQAAVAI